MRYARVACLEGTGPGRVSQPCRAKPPRTQRNRSGSATRTNTKLAREAPGKPQKPRRRLAPTYWTRVATQLRAPPPHTSHVGQKPRRGNRRSLCAEAHAAWTTSPPRRLRRSAAAPKHRCPQQAITSKHLQKNTRRRKQTRNTKTSRGPPRRALEARVVRRGQQRNIVP